MKLDILKLYSCTRSAENEENLPFKNNLEMFWYCLVCVCLLFTSIVLYYASVLYNNLDDINTYLFENLSFGWANWYLVILIVTLLIILYICSIKISGTFHFIKEKSISLFFCNKIFVVFALVCCIVYCVVFSELYSENFDLASLSIHLLLPIFHVVFLALWILLLIVLLKIPILLRHETINNAVYGLYASSVFVLLILPFIFSNPCVSSSLDPKPLVIGHRGCPSKAPENTLLSFEKAIGCNVFALESDVHLSSDGIPFLMHDRSLRRTTNVADVFPSRMNNPGESFTMSELQQLNAGDWYLHSNPFMRNHMLTSNDKRLIKEQTIPTLDAYVRLAHSNSKHIIFDLKRPSSANAYHKDFVSIVVKTILDTGIPQSNVLWLNRGPMDLTELGAPNFTLIAETFIPNAYTLGIKGINLQYAQISSETAKEAAVSIISYLINTYWLYSLMWCEGVWATTSNYPCVLATYERPIFYLTPSQFYAIWISLDALFLVCVIVLVYYYHNRILMFRKWFDQSSHTCGTEITPFCADCTMVSLCYDIF